MRQARHAKIKDIMMNILGKLAQLQHHLKEATAKLETIEVAGESGGGMVKVTATGLQRIKSVKIEEALLEAGNREMLEDLLVAGLNQALEAASDKARQSAQETFGGMIPPGIDLGGLVR